jgi:Nucleotidyltransferase domain
MVNAMDSIREALRAIGIDNAQLDGLVSRVPKTASGILLYGSRARGDHRPDSDFDLLLLVSKPEKSIRSGLISLSFYSEEQLLSASRTLYGTHLLRDGVVLWEHADELTSTLSQLEPAHPNELLARVLQLAIVLDDGHDPAESAIKGLAKLARYLLRTAIYATAMKLGNPCFSVTELADRFNDPELALLLASDPAITGEATFSEYEMLITRLRKYLGPLPRNPWGSVEALIVESWESDRVLAAVATRTISADQSAFDYADLPKIVL